LEEGSGRIGRGTWQGEKGFGEESEVVNHSQRKQAKYFACSQMNRFLEDMMQTISV
jgi:hypothetical protein